jgi:uncharacterized membrane protein
MLRRAWTDVKIEHIVGRLLISGVLLSAITVATGGVLFLFEYGKTSPHYHLFHGEPAELRSLRPILTGAAQFHSRAVIQLGLLLLIATPVARVIFSVVGFALEGDRTYVVITLVVLTILLSSLFGFAP